MGSRFCHSTHLIENGCLRCTVMKLPTLGNMQFLHAEVASISRGSNQLKVQPAAALTVKAAR